MFIVGECMSSDIMHCEVQSKVTSWIAELEELASVASTQPHAAFCAFTHGIVNK